MTFEDPILQLISDEAGKCINCGFCESVCPTFPAVGFNSIYGARGRVDLGNYLLREISEKGKIELRFSDSFYSCLSCNACLQVCPAGVNAGRVSELSRTVIANLDYFNEQNEQQIAKMIVSVTMKYMNPLGVREKCSKWAQDLHFEDGSRTLFYTGNMFQLMPYSTSLGRMKKLLGKKLSQRFAGFISKHPSLIKVAGLSLDKKMKSYMETELRNIVTLLESSGISFSYLGKDEPYPGTFLYDLGYEKEFSEYANRVYSLLKAKGIERLIVADPHTYDLLTSKYPKYVRGFDLEVLYYLDILDTKKFKKSDASTTLHEPCLLTRGGKINNSPSRLLSNLTNLELPKMSGENTSCCGGPDELLYGEIAEKVSQNRFLQLKSVNAQKIVTACPICFANLNKSEEVIELPNLLTSLLNEN